MEFQNTLINLRIAYNFSQKEFAKVIGVTTGVLAEWESGESEPNLEQLMKISTEFNISLDMLINGSKNDGESVLTSKNNNQPSLYIPKSKFVHTSVGSSNLLKKYKKLAIIISSVIVILILVFFAFSLNGLFSFSDNTKLISQAESSVVKIYCYDYNGKEVCTGSGFIAFDGQTIVTNYHVASEGYTLKVSTDQDISYDVDSIITYSKEKDISILKLLQDTGLKPLPFGNPDDVEKGENVTVIGSPLGIKNTVSQGVLSGRIPAKDFDILQFTAAISSGSSGGALFNSNGEVIGVTYASYENGQNLNLAIPSNIVSDLYNNKGIPTEVNLLYRRNYPYVDYLNEAKETTINDLNCNPSDNTGNYVINSVYISSFNGATLETSTQAFIADNKASVSGNFSHDCSSEDSSLLSVQWNNDNSDLVYYDKSIDIGSFVTVILNHRYFSGSRNICKAIINQNE